MKTLLVAAVAEELQGLSSDFNILYTGIGKENVENILRKYLTDLLPNERQEFTVFNVGTAGCRVYERGSLLFPTTVTGYSNGVLQSISVVDWGAEKYLDCRPVVCYSSDVFIDAENQSLLDSITHDCVDMEAFTEANICKEFGVRFISLKLVSDCFNVTFEQWKISLNEVVSHLTQAIETLKKSNVI